MVAFNQRIEPARTTAPFPVEPLHEWLPKLPGRPLFREYYVAVDDKGAVRGAYILKLQPFHVNGEVAVIGNLQLPISEGIVDKTYSHVAAQLLRDALRRQPLLFSLGMGGCDEPVARLLIAAGWSTFSVPFYFRVVHTSAFLKNIAYLRRWAALRWCSTPCADGTGVAGHAWVAGPSPPRRPPRLRSHRGIGGRLFHLGR